MIPEALKILFGLSLAVVLIILSTKYLKLHAFFSLLVAACMYGVIAGLSFLEIVSAIQSGFGSLLQQIGLLVAFGAVLGTLLEKTGAMEAISSGLLHFFGTKRVVFAMSCIGVLVGIPVFCDSGFIILSRLIPSLAARVSVPSASLTLALSSGLYTSHTLIPPTPGPLAAAFNLGAADSIGDVIVIGIIGAVPVLLVSYFFSRYAGLKIMAIEKDDFPDRSVRKISFPKAILPLALPIVLIAFASFIKVFNLPASVEYFISIAGTPVIALFIGLLSALFLIRKTDTEWPGWISNALKDAGIILLITGAGGAFGSVIKSSGVDEVLKHFSASLQMNTVMLLSFAWFIAAVLKTAQGSTTSSMIIASSLIAPLATVAGVTSSTHLALIVLSIGGGAMCLSHANDSYFWVVSQFGRLSSQDTFRTFTVLTFLQSLTVLLTVIALSFILL